MNIIIYFQEMWQLALRGQTQGYWFWAGFYTFIVCNYSLIYQIRTRFWPFVQGELVEIGVENFGATEVVKSNQDYTSKALYHYNVSGTDYDGTRISPWVIVASHNAKFILEKQMSSLQRFPDGTIKVFYNPNNPKKSFLIVAGKMGLCITLSISVLPFILYYFKYYV